MIPKLLCFILKNWFFISLIIFVLSYKVYLHIKNNAFNSQKHCHTYHTFPELNNDFENFIHVSRVLTRKVEQKTCLNMLKF